MRPKLKKYRPPPIFIINTQKTIEMTIIFGKLAWEKEHGETIEIFLDCEGYEQKEREPIGDYGYKVKPNHMYKFLTSKGIYFYENGKVECVYRFNNQKQRSHTVTEYLKSINFIKDDE